MKIHLENKVDAEKYKSIIIPCLPEEDISGIIESIFPTFSYSGELSTENEEHFTLLIDGIRVECVGCKKDSPSHFQKALQVFTTKNIKRLGQNCALYALHLSDHDLVRASIQGVVLGTYDLALYKQNSRESSGLDNLGVIADESLGSIVTLASNTADTQKSIFDLVNAPSNRKKPETLANWAVESGRANGFSVTVMEYDELVEKGFEGLLAVNRGSEDPAKFIICDYNPQNANKTIALVGKGITFDTGGVSLKPSNNMHLMKSDMGGAAAVLGAVELAAKQKVAHRVISFVPTTDNSIGTKAIKPGDVIDSYSGKTIEVINTDAEGRLILADGLAYAIEQYDPDIIIDLATLTGSVVRALGNHCAGLFTHNDTLADQLIAAGETSGERLWRMPLWHEYAEDMKSDIADIKNLSDKPLAGAVTAAKFLEFFTSEHENWAHIDIAGTAFKSNGIARNHAATAYGVLLLYTFLDQLN